VTIRHFLLRIARARIFNGPKAFGQSTCHGQKVVGELNTQRLVFTPPVLPCANRCQKVIRKIHRDQTLRK
jgi:hypothetical protein